MSENENNWMQLVTLYPHNKIFYFLIQFMLKFFFPVKWHLYSRLKLREERVRGLRHLVSDLRSICGAGQAQDGSGAASRVSSCIW